jgi:hypothetical protein
MRVIRLDHKSSVWAGALRRNMHLFDEGWNKLRDTIFAYQKRLGVIPQHAKLTPWPKGTRQGMARAITARRPANSRYVLEFAKTIGPTVAERGRRLHQPPS